MGDYGHTHEGVRCNPIRRWCGSSAGSTICVVLRDRAPDAAHSSTPCLVQKIMSPHMRPFAFNQQQKIMHEPAKSAAFGLRHHDVDLTAETLSFDCLEVLAGNPTPPSPQGEYDLPILLNISGEGLNKPAESEERHRRGRSQARDRRQHAPTSSLHRLRGEASCDGE